MHRKMVFIVKQGPRAVVIKQGPKTLNTASFAFKKGGFIKLLSSDTLLTLTVFINTLCDYKIITQNGLIKALSLK